MILGKGMKHKLLLILILLFSTAILANDDIHEKQRELSEVQNKIDQHKRMVNEAEEQRRRVEQTKQHTQRQLNLQQKKLQELTSAGQNLQSSLDLSKSLLNQTENKISELQFACNETILHILLADQAHEKLLQANVDPHLLSVLLSRLIIENRKLDV